MQGGGGVDVRVGKDAVIMFGQSLNHAQYPNGDP